MTSGEELQRLLYSTLKADSAVMAIAAGVYDSVPADPFGSEKTAYISFGPVDASEDDAECISSQRVTVQLDVWSRATGSLECKTLTDLVRKALHRKSLELTENALVDTWVELTRVFKDPDGVTLHGVVQVTVLIEEPA
jgi:hypothetical protein